MKLVLPKVTQSTKDNRLDVSIVSRVQLDRGENAEVRKQPVNGAAMEVSIIHED